MLKKVLLKTNINTNINTNNNDGDSIKTSNADDQYDNGCASIHTNFDTELWARIAAVTFDPPDTKLTFVSRLVRETGWTPTFAAEAMTLRF